MRPPGQWIGPSDRHSDARRSIDANAALPCEDFSGLEAVEGRAATGASAQGLTTIVGSG